MSISIQAALSHYCEGIALNHLRAYADPRPESRCFVSAAGLVELADYIRSLRPDDPRLRDVAVYVTADGTFRPPTDMAWSIARFRFASDDRSCDAFLTYVVGSDTAIPPLSAAAGNGYAVLMHA